MLPLDKVKGLISKHSELEKDLSSGEIDKKAFAEKSKEYSDLNEIISDAKKYISFEKDRIELQKILVEQNTDKELLRMAEIELKELEILHEKNENRYNIQVHKISHQGEEIQEVVHQKISQGESRMGMVKAKFIDHLEQMDQVKVHENTRRNLEVEISGYKVEAQKQRKQLFLLEKDGEKYGSEAAEATSKYLQALEEVKVREMSVIQLQKRILEGETKLKQQLEKQKRVEEAVEEAQKCS